MDHASQPDVPGQVVVFLDDPVVEELAGCLHIVEGLELDGARS
jgi:hypothetical protein